MKKLSIEDGTVVLVPLAPQGYCVGVVLRADGKGRALGAFFGPKVTTISEVRNIEIQQQSAVLLCRFGDHALSTGRWPIVGKVPKDAIAKWTIPEFTRRHDDPEKCYITRYDDHLNVVEERIAPVKEAANLPHDSQLGSGVVERKLSGLLN